MKRRATNGIEMDATSKWARRYLTCFQRAGYARYGKNMVIRRERRESKVEIEGQLDDYWFGCDPD